MARRRPDPEGEDGFVLIGAVWLLVLCAGIAGLMLLRSVEASRSEARAERALRDQLLRSAAVETAKADRLFDGQRSGWWTLPTSGQEDVDGVQITVELNQSDVILTP